MSLPHLLFVHGWAYDANIWGPIRSRLGDPACTAWERGYFEEPGLYGIKAEPLPPQGPYIAVGHSMGAMRLLDEAPPGMVGFVSVCGFSRFTDAPGFPGTSVRVVERMLSRFRLMPGSVVAEFRARCGSPATTVYGLQAERLREDLEGLRDGDQRAAATALDVPVLSLTAGADPIVSAAQTAASFPTAQHESLAGVGHLLPLRAPEWCAAQIQAFAARIAS